MLILGGLDDIFNLLLFPVGILHTLSATLHHNTSLIFHLGSPVGNSSLIALLGGGDSRTLWPQRYAYAQAK